VLSVTGGSISSGSAGAVVAGSIPEGVDEAASTAISGAAAAGTGGTVVASSGRGSSTSAGRSSATTSESTVADGDCSAGGGVGSADAACAAGHVGLEVPKLGHSASSVQPWRQPEVVPWGNLGS